MSSSHLFDQLLCATPRQICWKWADKEFYYVHDPDCPVSEDQCLDNKDVRQVKCLFICACSACQQHALFPHDLDNIEFLLQNGQRNSQHCILCECDECVCELRKKHKQFTSSPRLYSWNNSCLYPECPVCYPT